MNVSCPECGTTYRVDPAKVPEGGILAECERCPATFRVVAGTTGDGINAGAAEAVLPGADYAGAAESGLSGTDFNGGAAEAGQPGSSSGDGDLEDPTGHADAVTLDIAEVPQPGIAGLLGESDPDPPESDERSSGFEELPAGAGESSWTEPADDDLRSYAGASDVAFHTEGVEVEDLPYLEPPSGGTFSRSEETERPAGAAAPMKPGTGPSADDEQQATSVHEQPHTQEQESTSDDSAAPGETALPPAPFGARSDPHRRAARLARALVSDIVVYHPERRSRSLRQGTLRQEFREEIRKSWEEYANQVGSDFARQTTYFRDALNEILAEGATVF